MNVRYRVDLSQIERTELKMLLSGGKHASRKLKRAQILLAADAGARDEEIATSVGVGGSTVYRTKRRFVEGNLERALSEEPRPGAERKLTGKEEALLVATACAGPPKGRARWTLKLLAGAMVKLTEHKSLSHETVRRRLAENGLKPWRRDMWCVPRVDGEYVARMEDVLDLYAEASDPEHPVVCSHGDLSVSRWLVSSLFDCQASSSSRPWSFGDGARRSSQGRPRRAAAQRLDLDLIEHAIRLMWSGVGWGRITPFSMAIQGRAGFWQSGLLARSNSHSVVARGNCTNIPLAA
uniref:IS630 family transposase n=1 Tax=Bradyrhizobium sp. Cp5.3 TaxID=443598 RepID=UPI001FDAB6B2